MMIDPTVQALLDDGTLTVDELAASAFDALAAKLREGFAPWARARGADAAKIERVKFQLERLLREGRAEMLRPRSTSLQ